MAEEKTVFQKLAEKIMVPNSKIVPDLFAMLITPEDGEKLLTLPGFIGDISKNWGMDEKAAQEKLMELFHKGLVFKSQKPEGTKYRMVREVVQFHDATILWHGATQEYYDMWQDFMETEWPDFAKMVGQIMPKPVTRIIPVEEAIQPKSEILSYETCKEVIDNSKSLAVTKCTCRVIARKCDSPIEVCIQEGRAAEYAIERGTGREITREEATDIIIKAEEAGLMHVTMNRTKDFHYICNCCGCCCIAMPVMIEYGSTMVDPSRYLAEIDAQACDGCETCVDRCWFKAIKMEDDVAVLEAEKCMGCGVCQVTCAPGAITLTKIREKDFIPAA